MLTAGFAAIAVPGWWFAARERGPWLVTGLAVAAQSVLHSAFAAAQTSLGSLATSSPARLLVDNLCSADGRTYGSRAGTSVFATSSTGGMDAAGTDHSAAMDQSGAMDHMAAMDHSGAMDHMGSMGLLGHDMAGMSSTGMLAAHLLAALICGLWLAQGERATFQVLRAVAGRLLGPLHPLFTAPLPPPRRRLRPSRGLSDRLPQGLRCARALDRRGPPAVLAAF